MEQRVRRRAVAGRDGVQAGHLGVRAVVDQERVQAGNRYRALDAVRGADPTQVLRHVPVGLLHALHGGELDRLVVGDRAGGRVADHELDRRCDHRHGEGDQEAKTVVAVAPSPQHPDRVDRSHQEAGDQVGGQDHVGDLVGDRGIEDHLQRLDVGHRSVRAEREPLRLVHPGVGGDNRERAAKPGDYDRDARPEVRPSREAVPAEDVDRDEDRFEEEEDPLDREQNPEDAAEAPGELRPQEAELERQHGAGDGAHGEGHGSDLGPAPRELHGVGVVAAKSQVVGDQHHRREGDAEARQDDVEPERERHLAAGGRQLGGRRERRRIGEDREVHLRGRQLMWLLSRGSPGRPPSHRTGARGRPASRGEGEPRPCARGSGRGAPRDRRSRCRAPAPPQGRALRTGR